MAGKQIRNGNPSSHQPLPHRQQTAVRVAASNGSTLTPKHQIPPEGSTTCSESAESSEISTATNISSRISTSKFAKNEELPRKCLVVRRSAPKQGVTKTEIRLVIYNETQKKEGLRKMEYPALMDASEMLADRLRDLETKSKKDGYEKEKEIRRDLEGERRPAPTPDHQKEVIAKLKKVAPSLCNPSDVTTAELIDEKSGNTSDSSIQVSPSKNRRKRAPDSRPLPPTVTPSTTVISDKDLEDIIEKSESEPKSKTSNDDSQSKSSSTYSTPVIKPSKKTPKKDKKKRKKKRSDAEDESETPVKVRPSRQIKDKSAKSPSKVPTRDSSDRPIRSKRMKKEPPPQSKSDPADESEISLFPTDDTEVPSKPLRKPPPHAIRERKSNKNRPPKNPVEPESESRKPKKDQPREEKPKDPIEPSEPRRAKRDRDQPKEEEPKEPVEPSQPRRTKKGRDQPKMEEPKEVIEPSEPRRVKKGRDEPKNEEPKEPKKPMEPLCDRRDCCMQEPCVKKDGKNEKKKEPESDQPTVTEKDEIPSGKRGKKKKNKTRTDIVIRDDTSTTNNTNIEDSLYVLKSILKKLESSNSIKLKNNPDKEKVKAQLEKIIKAIEGKLANGTKLNADDLDRMKRIVAKTAELRGTVSLTTTVTVTESISVEDEDTN